MPPSVIAPFVAVLGVNPVVPAEKLRTPVLAIVTALEPLKDPPDSPAPIVRVWVVLEVIVPLPPKATLTPLNVTLEFAKELFGIAALIWLGAILIAVDPADVN